MSSACFMWENLKLCCNTSMQENMKQEYAQFETLGGKGKSKAKEAPIFTPSKPLMKVMSADASTMPHTVHGMMLTKYSSHVM
ncbi:hypothetical protein ACFX2A_026075 [Malus domestica]